MLSSCCAQSFSLGEKSLSACGTGNSTGFFYQRQYSPSLISMVKTLRNQNHVTAESEKTYAIVVAAVWVPDSC